MDTLGARRAACPLCRIHHPNTCSEHADPGPLDQLGTVQHDLNTVLLHAGIKAEHLARLIVCSTNPAHALASTLEAIASSQYTAAKQLGLPCDVSRQYDLARRLRGER